MVINNRNTEHLADIVAFLLTAHLLKSFLSDCCKGLRVGTQPARKFAAGLSFEAIDRALLRLLKGQLVLGVAGEPDVMGASVDAADLSGVGDSADTGECVQKPRLFLLSNPSNVSQVFL